MKPKQRPVVRTFLIFPDLILKVWGNAIGLRAGLNRIMSPRHLAQEISLKALNPNPDEIWEGKYPKSRVAGSLGNSLRT